MFVQLGLQLISDMTMRIYSEAGIAESPLLYACAYLDVFVVSIEGAGIVGIVASSSLAVSYTFCMSYK